MEKRELKEKTKFQKWDIFRVFHSAIPACAGASAGKRIPKSAIGGSCVMKNLISGLKYSEIRNWGSFRVFHSAIRIPKSAIGIRGFTLIEVIILVVMAGILLPVIIVPFVTGVKSSGKPEMATKAMYLAHQRMEELTKFQYTDPTLNPTGLTAYAAIPDNSGYEWQWEIVLVDNNFSISGTDAGYKRILVRVKDLQNDTYEIYSVVTRFP